MQLNGSYNCFPFNTCVDKWKQERYNCYEIKRLIQQFCISKGESRRVLSPYENSGW